MNDLDDAGSVVTVAVASVVCSSSQLPAASDEHLLQPWDRFSLVANPQEKKVVTWFVCMSLVSIFCLVYILMPHSKVASALLHSLLRMFFSTCCNAGISCGPVSMCQADAGIVSKMTNGSSSF